MIDKQIFDDEQYKSSFRQYLINRGYSQVTPSGNPSTVYDYIKRIDKVCERERINWQSLSIQIKQVGPKYDIGGTEEAFGHKSHDAVINALRRFYEFIKEQK